MRVALIVLGLGRVGRALLGQIRDVRESLSQRTGIRLVPVGVADSRALLLDRAGLPDGTLADALQAKAAGRSLDSFPGGLSHTDMVSLLRPGTIVADLTAAQETAGVLRTALQAGCGAVLANKHPLGGSWAAAREFLSYRCLRYEATVGAGLPVIATLRTLLSTGDRVVDIEGCMSGTLGFLCTQLEHGVAYSEAVTQARSLGYTEPDPREDLSGRDVARKALILARTAGWPLEFADLTVEPMYPRSLSDVATQEFLEAMPTLDAAYARRFAQAASQGQVVRYVARVSPAGGTVGLVDVEPGSLLGALRGPANYFALNTTRYAEEPLVVSGPGAGPDVTAAGVLGDIVDLAFQHAGRITYHAEERQA